MEYTPHWKRIWITVSGRKNHIGSFGASTALNLVKNDLINGIAMYKPYSENTYNLSLEKLSCLRDPDCQKMYHHISISMNLDPAVTWAMICNYLKFECYVDIENLEDIKKYIKDHPKFDIDIWQFYTLERMFLLKILYCVVENCMNKDHRFFDLYRKFVDEVTMKTIRANLIQQFCLISKDMDLHNRGSYLGVADWTERTIREQLQILFIILTTLAHEKCDVDGFIQLLKTFKEENFVFKSYSWDKTPIGKSSTLESIRNVEVAIVLASLEDFWHNTEMWYFRLNEIDSEIDEILKNWNSLVLLLAWVALHLTVPLEIAMPNYEFKLHSYLRRALQSNAFSDLHEIVSNVLFKDSLAGLTVKMVIFTILEVLCIKLGANVIYDHEGTVTLLGKLLQVPEIAVVWHEGSDEGARSFYNITASLFPLHFHPLSTCIRSLISVKCDTHSVVNGLNNLQLYAEMCPESFMQTLNKDFVLTSHYRPFSNDLVVFEKGTKISFETRNKVDIVRFHGSYSYFKVLLHIVDTLLKELQDHKTNLVLESGVESGYKIVLDILKIEPSLVATNPDVQQLLQYSLYLLNAVSKPRVKNVNLIALCFEILVYQFDINPKDVMKHLHSMKFLPHLLKDSYSIEDFSNLDILSVVSINEYTSNSFSSNSCDLVCLYIKLVKKSIKSRLFVDEIILPGLMFLITKHFPKFSTQLLGDNEKTRNVCCKLISLCHLILEQNRMALREKELLYVDSVINLFVKNKLYTATFLSIFRVRHVELELILSVETNYVSGPLLKLVKCVKRALKCIFYILNHMYLNNYRHDLFEQYLWQLSPNGSILSLIAEYKLHSFDNEIPEIAWDILTQFALISRKPLLQSFTVGSREIRQWVTQSLYDPLLSDNIKISIINFIKACVYEQASMIAAFFNIEDHQLQPGIEDSVAKYMLDCISNIGKDVTILSEPLQQAGWELFHVLWKTNKKHIIKRMVAEESFWKLMGAPLLKPERIPLDAAILSFEIFVLQFYPTTQNVPTNYTLAIADMFDTPNKFVELWIDRAIAITQVDNLNPPPPHLLSVAVVLVIVLKKFLLVIRRFYPAYETCWNTHAVEKKCLEILLHCSGHSINHQLITQWADLSLVFSTHRDRNKTEILEILEIASKILYAHVKLYMHMDDKGRLTIVTLLFVVLKDSFEVISQDRSLIQWFLHPIIKLFYFEYSIIYAEDKENKNNEMFYHKWVIILKMINAFLQMDSIHEFKHLFTTCLYLDKVFEVMYLVIKNKWPSKMAEITMATLIYYAESKMDDHFDFYFNNITYRLVSPDMYKFNVNSLKLGVIPNEVQEHWRLYTQVIRLNQLLLRKRGSFVVDPLLFFVKRHNLLIKNAILSVAVVLTEANLLLTCHILHFVHDLLRYFRHWPTNNSSMFEPILNSINDVLSIAGHILLIPTIVMFKFESGTYVKVPHSEIPEINFVNIFNRYLEIITCGLMCFNQSNPPFYKLLDVYQDTNFTVRVEYDYLFPSLMGANPQYLHFNTLPSILQFLCKTLTRISAVEDEGCCEHMDPPLKDYVGVIYPWNTKGDINSVLMMFDDTVNEICSYQIHWFSRLNSDILLQALSALCTFLATQLFLSTRDPNLGYDEIYNMQRHVCSELLCFYKFVYEHVTKVTPSTNAIQKDQPCLYVDVSKVCCDEETEITQITSIDDNYYIVLIHWFKHVCQLVYSSKFDEMLSQSNVKLADSLQPNLFRKLAQAYNY